VLRAALKLFSFLSSLCDVKLFLKREKEMRNDVKAFVVDVEKSMHLGLDTLNYDAEKVLSLLNWKTLHVCTRLNTISRCKGNGSNEQHFSSFTGRK
jgi:hypothetical protein